MGFLVAGRLPALPKAQAIKRATQLTSTLPFNLKSYIHPYPQDGLLITIIELHDYVT